LYQYAVMTELVLYESTGAVARITLNRPEKLNALSAGLVDELEAALRRAVADEEVKVVVVTGAGRAFSAGYDLGEEVADQPANADEWRTILARDLEVTMQLWRCPKPTIAAVRGWCVAGGCELAMACDLIVAAEDARFGEPEIRYGSGPVTLLMPFLIGQKKTNELLLTGDVIDAQEAHRIGLVNRVVPLDQLDDAVAELTAKIAPTPAAVLRHTKLALLRAYEEAGLVQAVAANLDISAILNAADTPEQREFDEIAGRDGLRAALEWRDSRYGGRLAAAPASGEE
jgi:enoyl-CoA hydratase/carnithine racemase